MTLEWLWFVAFLGMVATYYVFALLLYLEPIETRRQAELNERRWRGDV